MKQKRGLLVTSPKRPLQVKTWWITCLSKFVQGFRGLSFTAMAYSSTSTIGDTFRHSEKRGGGNDGKVSPSTASHAERESERRTDQFMASDSFYHRMEGMIKKGDVEAILKQQRKTLVFWVKFPHSPILL